MGVVRLAKPVVAEEENGAYGSRPEAADLQGAVHR